MRLQVWCAAMSCASILPMAHALDVPAFIGPIPYLGAEDSPFFGSGDCHALEDFQSGGLAVEGVEMNAGPVVVEDSGVFDPGELHYALEASTIGVIEFWFDAATIGDAPTSVGFVWTEGSETASNAITVTVIDGAGTSSFSHTFSDLTPNGGENVDDRFFGIEWADGISFLRIQFTPLANQRIDHLQFDLPELDTDADGVFDCVDPCPEDPSDACVPLIVTMRRSETFQESSRVLRGLPRAEGPVTIRFETATRRPTKKAPCEGRSFVVASDLAVEVACPDGLGCLLGLGEIEVDPILFNGWRIDGVSIDAGTAPEGCDAAWTVTFEYPAVGVEIVIEVPEYQAEIDLSDLPLAVGDVGVSVDLLGSCFNWECDADPKYGGCWCWQAGQARVSINQSEVCSGSFTNNGCALGTLVGEVPRHEFEGSEGGRLVIDIEGNCIGYTSPSVVTLTYPILSEGDFIYVPEHTPLLRRAIAEPGPVRVSGGLHIDALTVLEPGKIIESTTGPHDAVIDVQDGAGTAIRVVGADAESPVVFRGFTIRGGSGGSIVPSATFPAGGGVLVSESNLLLENCIVEGNFAGMGGGVAAFDSTLELRNCELEANGSYSVGGGLLSIDSATSITGSLVLDNISVSRGGGIYAAGGDLSVAGTLIELNDSGSQGGGLAWMGSDQVDAQMLVEDCVVQENLAVGGGGVWIKPGVSNAAVGSTSFCGNWPEQIVGSYTDLGGNGGCGVGCPADLSGDGQVDGADLTVVLSSWGPLGGVGDVNGDGVVDGADLAAVLAEWGSCQ